MTETRAGRGSTELAEIPRHDASRTLRSAFERRLRINLTRRGESLHRSDTDERPMLYRVPVPLNPTDSDIRDQHSHQDAKKQVVERM